MIESLSQPGLSRGVSPAQPSSAAANDGEALRRAAQSFEAVFIAEMLSQAGFARPRESFGGGAGEEVFSGLLVDEWAERLAARGGFGIAARILQAFAVEGGRGGD